MWLYLSRDVQQLGLLVLLRRHFIARLGDSPSPDTARKGADCESVLWVLCCATLLYECRPSVHITLAADWVPVGNGSSSLSLLKGKKQVRHLVTSFCCLLSSRRFSCCASFSSASFLCRASSSAFSWALKWRKVKFNLFHVTFSMNTDL